MHSHPDAYPTAFESSLPIFGGCDGIGGTRERREERVALRVHLNTPVALKRAAQQQPVLRERLRVSLAELMQQPGRALDVGEEEGDGAARKLAHGF